DVGVEAVLLEELRLLGEKNDHVAHADGGHADMNLAQIFPLRERAGGREQTCGEKQREHGAVHCAPPERWLCAGIVSARGAVNRRAKRESPQGLWYMPLMKPLLSSSSTKLESTYSSGL